MPWKESTMSEQRLVLVHRVVELKHRLSEVAQEMGVSRKTAYKWVGRYRIDPSASMSDRSRRPPGPDFANAEDAATEKSVDAVARFPVPTFSVPMPASVPSVLTV